MTAGLGHYSICRTYNNDGEVGPRLTHVCHCVLLWVFDVGQDHKYLPSQSANTQYVALLT